MLEPGRSFNASNSAYGFNGKIKDNEMYGEGNAYDFGDRIYSPRGVVWLSTDPLQKKYPFLSPYSFAGNNPILYVDADGKEIWIYYQVTGSSGTTVTKKVQYLNGKLYEVGGALYTGKDAYVMAVKADLDAFRTDHPEAAYRLKVLETSKQIHTIENTSGGNNNNPVSKADDKAGIPTGTKTKYDPTNWTSPIKEHRNPRVALGHEFLGHGYDSDQGLTDYGAAAGIDNFEISAVNMENRIRTSTGEHQKTTYGGITIPAANLINPKQYQIKSGDTLSEIAQSAGTTVANLQKLNPSIADANKIKTGDTIIVK